MIAVARYINGEGYRDPTAGRAAAHIDACMTNETMREYRAMKAAGRLGKLGEVAASVRR